MTHSTYILILCIIVFTLLTGLLSAMLYFLLKQGHKLIYYGHEDERIKIEYMKAQRSGPIVKIISGVFTFIMLGAFFAAFVLALYIQANENKPVEGIPMPRVVLSGSMATVSKRNTYIEENGLTDQMQRFDLIFVNAMPEEQDLKLYDVVLYEDEHGEYIIHRIVKIEAPNSTHPDEYHYYFRGDANPVNDYEPVTYSQMRAIYKGERIPNIGSFFAFMQSPAGWLCIILIIVAVIATPIMEKKLWEAKLARLRAIALNKYRHPKRRFKHSWLRAILMIFALTFVIVAEKRPWKGRKRRCRVCSRIISPRCCGGRYKR